MSCEKFWSGVLYEFELSDPAQHLDFYDYIKSISSRFGYNSVKDFWVPVVSAACEKKSMVMERKQIEASQYSATPDKEILLIRGERLMRIDTVPKEVLMSGYYTASVHLFLSNPRWKPISTATSIIQWGDGSCRGIFIITDICWKRPALESFNMPWIFSGVYKSFTEKVIDPITDRLRKLLESAETENSTTEPAGHLNKTDHNGYADWNFGGYA